MRHWPLPVGHCTAIQVLPVRLPTYPSQWFCSTDITVSISHAKKHTLRESEKLSGDSEGQGTRHAAVHRVAESDTTERLDINNSWVGLFRLCLPKQTLSPLNTGLPRSQCTPSTSYAVWLNNYM